MNKNLIMLLIGVSVVGILVTTLNNNTSNIEDEKVLAGVSAMQEDNDNLLGEDDVEEIDIVRTNWSEEYSDENLATAAVNSGKAVIFFHAGWCPTCKAAEKDFINNISQIPDDVTILKADYDTETELKEKYGIVVQDTFVQVDSNGEEMSKWNSGGEGIKSLLANII